MTRFFLGFTRISGYADNGYALIMVVGAALNEVHDVRQ